MALCAAVAAVKGDWSVRCSSIKVQYDGYQCGVWKIIKAEVLHEYVLSDSCDLRQFHAEFLARKIAANETSAQLAKRITDGNCTAIDKQGLSSFSAERRNYYRARLKHMDQQNTLPWVGEMADENDDRFERQAVLSAEFGYQGQADDDTSYFVEAENGVLTLVDGGPSPLAMRSCCDTHSRTLITAIEHVAPGPRREGISSTILMPDASGLMHKVAKRTLVVECQRNNIDPSSKSISKDRLRRILQINECASKAADEEVAVDVQDVLRNLVDVCIATREGGATKMHFGRVQQMLCKSGSSRGVREWLQPVRLDNLPAGLSIVCNWYVETNEQGESKKGKTPKRKRSSVQSRCVCSICQT